MSVNIRIHMDQCAWFARENQENRFILYTCAYLNEVKLTHE